MTSRTVEITENESVAVANAMNAFLTLTRHKMLDMEPGQAADLAAQTTEIQAFLDKVKYAFKHNRPTRKAKIYAIDGGQY